MSFINSIIKLSRKVIPTNKSLIRLIINGLKRSFNGEATSEKNINKLVKLKISLQKPNWSPSLRVREVDLTKKLTTKPFIESRTKQIYRNKGIGKKGIITAASVGIPTYFLTHYNTGPTATILDLIGNTTRRDDHTPRFTRTYGYDNFTDAQKAFLLDAVDKKQTKYWNSPEERAAYFEKHPNDTVRTGWRGRIAGTGRKQSDYKKYYDVDFGGLSDMPKLTGFGLNVGMKNPVEAGMYEIMQTLGSFPIAYTKDHAIIDDTWDFNKADRDKEYPKNKVLNILQTLRIFAGKHGTNEADNYIPVVTTHAEVPYKDK